MAETFCMAHTNDNGDTWSSQIHEGRTACSRPLPLREGDVGEDEAAEAEDK